MRSPDYLTILSDKGTVKRIRANDITRTNRPVRGELIAKKVKSNPQKVRYLVTGSVYDSIDILNGAAKTIMFKDVPIMAKDATFSSVIPLDIGFSLIKGIEEVPIVDIPVTPESTAVEMMSLDLEE